MVSCLIDGELHACDAIHLTRTGADHRTVFRNCNRVALQVLDALHGEQQIAHFLFIWRTLCHGLQVTGAQLVPVNILHYPTSHGLCADGYHVAGDWVRPAGDWIEQYLPSVHANGDSDIYVYNTHPDENSQNGSDSNGRPYYRGLYVTLGNHSWTQAKQGSFTWTCDPN